MKIRSTCLCAALQLFLTVSPLSLFGQTFPVNNIKINGATDKRINIVFLSEGYTASEITKFNSDVQNAIDDLFNSPPYREYESYFNMYAIEVPSNQSGADHPGTARDEPANLPSFTYDTYFNSSFDVSGIHRLLVPEYYKTVSVLQNSFPEWDIVFMLVNHDWYGGSGGTAATFSLHSSSSEIAMHELGHSFASLADEYESGGLTPYEAPNATAQTSRDSIKWNRWIHADTPIPTPESNTYQNVVGLFEGAVYHPTGWYRPKLNCKMRALGIPFCEVCSEQTILSIYNLVNTIETYQPLVTGVTVFPDSVQEFFVQRKAPEPNTLKTEWYLNGRLSAVNTDKYSFDAAQYNEDDHQLQAIVTDTTEMVRNDPDGLRVSTITWQIHIDRTAVAVNDNPEEIPQTYSLYQNYPNPFNPSTIISYDLKRSTRVVLTVYDILGQEIAVLVNENQEPGFKSVTWEGLDKSGQKVSSGLYVYKLQADNEVFVRKMLLLK